MTDNPAKDERIHAEAPAEGDPDADPTGIRAHSQEPAEGADIPDAGGKDAGGKDASGTDASGPGKAT